MKNYLEQLHYILDKGIIRSDRTGVGTISCFGLQTRYNMQDGFPAITTRKLAWKTMCSELLWFISGSGNINDLKSIYRYNTIWDANYKDYLDHRETGNGLEIGDGDMGRIYGTQWRRWRTADGREIDQLQDAIDLIRTNPDSRRIIVNAWHPGENHPDQVALPPCHCMFQFYVAGNKLSLHMYQRSCDMFLGVPFNIASYSLLLHMIAFITHLEAHEFVHTLGDAHIYLDAVDQVKRQLSREPLAPPTLQIQDRGQSSIDDFVLDDLTLLNYQYLEPIKANMAV